MARTHNSSQGWLSASFFVFVASLACALALLAGYSLAQLSGHPKRCVDRAHASHGVTYSIQACMHACIMHCGLTLPAGPVASAVMLTIALAGPRLESWLATDLNEQSLN
eukprot:TRINITY_DN11605_c1_g1_i4.p1 TRINITY_DN11605_c1_g1~~TRINITY_DN11605_c1_g1_i4.p1  ORF type:complete len:109 (-),score=8.74 TRINITY_DN11605_c1_g1_i4:240-566(-)